MKQDSVSRFNHRKYQAFPAVDLPDRQWPNKQITQVPLWCSVDLRDGNQALIDPMTVEQKTHMWQLLVDMGFKEIEVGFPAASQPDFDFVRKIIEQGLIPEDVTVQVLVQAREELIARTYEALEGIPRAIVHVYNSTSTVQRERVFSLDKEGIKNIAIQGAQWVQEYATRYPQTEWTFQYSPESFTGTEMDYGLEVCNAVIDQWQPTPQNKCIINLPATVEVSTPNVFADQVEWMGRHLNRRDSVVLSVHTHNDRGTGVAASEMAVMAGADRVEGTLLGNGERTGNLDIITMAMNLYSQGVDPELDMSDMHRITQVFRDCNRMDVPARHPYAGELVFTAFSGSHQDAIRKCLNQQQDDEPWQVAYLPIDPRDLGRQYEEVIRINSQSGKGGIAYVMEQEHGLRLPRPLQIQFSQAIQAVSESTEKEVSGDQIWQVFQDTYLHQDQPLELTDYSLQRDPQTHQDQIRAVLKQDGQTHIVQGTGNGPISAFVSALRPMLSTQFELVDFSEHSIDAGEQAQAVCYIQIRVDDQTYFGVALDDDILMASLIAVLRGVNSALQDSGCTTATVPQSA